MHVYTIYTYIYICIHDMVVSIGQSFNKLSAIAYNAFFQAIHHTRTATHEQAMSKNGKQMEEIFDVYIYLYIYKRKDTYRCVDIHTYEHTYIPIHMISYVYINILYTSLCTNSNHCWASQHTQ